MKPEFKQQIAQRLLERIARDSGVAIIACPLCHSTKWVMAEDYTTLNQQQTLDSFVIGGLVIPAIPIICSNCGFITLISLGALGLLPPSHQPKGGETITPE